MSCGLGAMILVFMLIKHNIDKTVLETELLSADIEHLEEKEKALKLRLDETKRTTTELEEKIRDTSTEVSAKESDIFEIINTISRQQKDIASLTESIKNIKIEKKSDVIENTNVGEESYIIGLKVEGSRIAILVDQSASMTDELLIDVIRRKNLSDSDKKSGPKWQRTIRVAKWLLARLPENSQVNVIAFKDKAIFLGGSAWKSGRNSADLSTIIRELDALVPEGPTNLQAGLVALSTLKPTNVYLITDGFPTTGDSGYKSLNPFAACSSLWGQSNTISGECRARLFLHTLSVSSPPAAVRVNVILLPIEGDPGATNAYWAWTSRTGGLLISPATGWP